MPKTSKANVKTERAIDWRYAELMRRIRERLEYARLFGEAR